MELTGTHTFPAPQPVVWRVLTDPETLRRTLPGAAERSTAPAAMQKYATTRLPSQTT